MEQEGVVKYDLDFHPGEPPARRDVLELNAWRAICYMLGLVGAEPDRYGAAGFGNLSITRGLEVLITGTQTSHLPLLSKPELYYSRVLECWPDHNKVRATGTCEPSSEVMTHVQIYRGTEGVNAVIHAHSPEIWTNAARLGLPITDPSVEYGTKAMTEVVALLLRERPGCRAFVTGGHQDGVFVFGSSPDEAGTLLVRLLAQSLL